MSDGGGKTYKQGRLVMGRAVAIVKNGETGRKMAGKLIWPDARGNTRLNVGRALISYIFPLLLLIPYSRILDICLRQRVMSGDLAKKFLVPHC
jgi:hypothetical protein